MFGDNSQQRMNLYAMRRCHMVKFKQLWKGMPIAGNGKKVLATHCVAVIIQQIMFEI